MITRAIILAFIFSMATFNAFSQQSEDSIVTKKVLWTVFKYKGKSLKPRHLLDITKSNPEAYKEMLIAKRNNTLGNIIGCPGGVLFGFPIGTAQGGGNPNWVLAGVGAGLMIISIPFTSAYMIHAKKAVRIYNDGLKHQVSDNFNFKIEGTCNGIGIKMIF